MLLNLSKTLYDLKQATQIWHDKLSNFQIDNFFSKEKLSLFFIKLASYENLIIHIYVILKVLILCKELFELINMMWQLSLFLELQIHQST